MSAVSHIGCTNCGGAVGFTNVDRIVLCTWCGARLLVESDTFIPEYHVEATVDEVTARRRLQGFLGGEGVPPGLLRNARFKSAVLCFVPYHEIKSRRLGTIEMNVEEVHRTSKLILGETNTWQDKKTVTTTRETEVIMGDIHKVEPAVQREDYGLEAAGIFEMLKDDKTNLQPFDRAAQGKKGRIFQPTVSHTRFMEQLNIKGFTASVKDDTEYVETRVRRVFYPMWRLRYRFAGRMYGAVVDGVTGQVLFARAPQGDQVRATWLVGGVAITGFFFGKVMKAMSFADHLGAMMATGRDDGSVSGGIAMMLIMALGLALVWLAVWNQFRYPGDVLKIGGKLMVEKHNSLFGGRTRGPLFTWRGFLENLLGGTR